MHKRGVSKRMAKDQETEADKREEEAEIVTDTKKEQQAGDNEEARGGLDLQKLWELIKEDNRQTNEKIDSIKEDSKKQKEELNKKFEENSEKLENKIDSIKAVSYTHLDVYKRQVQ